MVLTPVLMKNYVCHRIHGTKPALMMVLVQISFVGVNVLYKRAVNDGMSLKVVVACRFIFAAAFIAPLALILERRNRPKMSWMVLFQAFFCGLLRVCATSNGFLKREPDIFILHVNVDTIVGLMMGSLVQNLYLETLALTSATFASAMSNLVPAFTFVLAVSFGLERFNFRTVSGQAKTIGSLFGICGAMLMTFYKGFEINILSTHFNLLQMNHSQHHHVAAPHASSTRSHLLGSLSSVVGCISYALWLIIQTKMSASYPCPYTSTALMSFMSAVQASLFALCTEKDWSQWRLGWNIRLLTVAYVGTVASGLATVLIAWCVNMRGPLFVSIFSPLMLVLVAIVGSFVLDEKLHLGSVPGAVLIVCGLYLVIWGKGKEMKKITQLVPSSCLNQSEPVDVIVMATLEDGSFASNEAELSKNGNMEKEKTGEVIVNNNCSK